MPEKHGPLPLTLPMLSIYVLFTVKMQINMSAYFPIVLEPEGLVSIKASTPPLLPKPNTPVEPKEPKGYVFGSVCLLLSMLVCVIMLFADTIDGSGAFIPTILLISFIFYLIELTVNSNTKKNYEKRFAKHQKDKEAYNVQLKVYNEKILHLQDPKNINSFRKNESIKIFKKALQLIKSDFSSKRGISEDNFINELLKYFPNDIQYNKSVGFEASDVELQYQPDIIIIEPETQLHVDIEIDEPYTILDNTPIHFYNNPNDIRRNKFFQKNGWLVIRFAEEQVVRFPKECCGFIAKTISEVTGSRSFERSDLKSTHVDIIKVWSKDEAIKMSQLKYRSSYLYQPKVKPEKTLEEELLENGFKATKVHTKLTIDRYVLLVEIYERHGHIGFKP